MGTILLWIINFMNLLNLYFLASWLPTVANQAGYGIGTSVSGGNHGATRRNDRRLHPGIPGATLGFRSSADHLLRLACINIALIGLPGLSLAMLFVVVFLAGYRRCGRADSRQCVVGDLLSDRSASHRNRRGAGHRTHRGHYRPGGWRRPDESAFAFAKTVPGGRGTGV